MGLAWSYKISHACNLPCQLKKSSSLTRFEINCKIHMKGVTVSPAISKWQQWQLANAAFVSAAWHCFFYSRAFFDFLFSKVSRPVGAMSVQPLPSDSDSAFIPFTYMFAKQGKQFGHMVTYDGFGCRSDMFRCRFGCCSDPWVFQETSLYCQDADL